MMNKEAGNSKQLIESLKDNEQYKIIERYNKPDYYNKDDDSSEKLIGVFLDVETTGLDYLEDKIIELAMVSFEYNQNGKIFRILNEFHRYMDPRFPIPPHITNLTGISNEMVKDKKISLTEVEVFLENASLIVSHNVRFDRSFMEAAFLTLPQKPWACSMNHVYWQEEGIESNKLEYIAYKQGFFYEKHRASADCLAGIHILAQTLPKSQKSVLSTILENSSKVTFKLHATSAPYEYKNLLKKRGYRWGQHLQQQSPCWSIELSKDKIKDEIDYLRTKVYMRHVSLPIDIINAYTRFSTLNLPDSNADKYSKEELSWVRGL